MIRESTILSSAKEFLIEALQNHSDKKLNFAIVHSVTAAELVLKERLARIHPTLISKNIDSKDLIREQTVSLSNLPQRLKNLGITLPSKEANLIRTFADWRNQIVHHMPSFDSKTAKLQLPQLLDFISVFLRRELETPLETFLPKQLYKTANGLLQEWERVASTAREIAKKEGNVLPNACPDCGATEVLCLQDDKKVHCHLCSSRQYHYDHCVECGRKTVSVFSSFDNGNYCDDCIDAAGDAYIQMLTDIERGK
jgi:predicted RNA-binding Zn-ribbon protein involved in translation (DUF1610 family)